MSRLPNLTLDDLPLHHRTRIEEAARPVGGVRPPWQVLLHSPEAAARYLDLTNYFREHSVLTVQTRELVTLATAREWNSQYIWTAHEQPARKVGVSDHTICAIRDRQTLNGLPTEDIKFIRYTQELLQNRRVADDTFHAIEELLGSQGVVELTILIGYYTMQAHTIAALEVNLAQGTRPLLPD